MPRRRTIKLERAELCGQVPQGWNVVKTSAESIVVSSDMRCSILLMVRNGLRLPDKNAHATHLRPTNWRSPRTGALGIQGSECSFGMERGMAHVFVIEPGTRRERHGNWNGRIRQNGHEHGAASSESRTPLRRLRHQRGRRANARQGRRNRYDLI